MDGKEVTSLRNEKHKANRASETEEQRGKRLRNRREKRREPKKTTRGKEKVVRSRRPLETVPGHKVMKMSWRVN